MYEQKEIAIAVQTNVALMKMSAPLHTTEYGNQSNKSEEKDNQKIKRKVKRKLKTTPQKNKTDEYISQMSEQERLVLKIATEHLETSFDIEKSIGYLNWIKNRT